MELDAEPGVRHGERTSARRPQYRVPRIDDRLAGLPARYSVSVAGDSLIRYDLTNGAAQEHSFGKGGPGEAVFVPSTSGPADESNGYYLGYVYDPARNGSDLVILMLPTSPGILWPASSYRTGCPTASMATG